MKRLLREPEPPPDVRPAMLSVWVALLLLLIPSLLFTTSEQKLVGLEIGLLGSGAALPSTGVVERVAVRLAATGEITIEADVRRSDVGAGAGEVVHRVVEVPALGGTADFSAMQSTLAGLQQLDHGLTRAILRPDPQLSTQQVVGLVDAVRSRGGAALLPDVIFEASETP